MRLCLLDDLLCGARALATVAPQKRAAFAATLLDQAHAAHAYAKRFRRPHPRWGNGSLMARALAEPGAIAGPKPGFDAISIMAAAIATFQSRHFPHQTLSCSPASPYVTLSANNGGIHGRIQNQTDGG
jgi:hypothetical protein